MELETLNSHLQQVQESNKAKKGRKREDSSAGRDSEQPERAGRYTKQARTALKEKAQRVEQVTGLLTATQPKKRSRSALKKLIAIQGGKKKTK